MSASNEWTEYHLTPRGSERGHYQADSGTEQGGDPPNDRVLTAVYREYMSSPFSKMEKTTEVTWRGPDKAEIDQFKNQFGNCPRKLDVS
jgi:hypothetical protein